MLKPFTLAVDDTVLEDLRHRLDTYRPLPTEPSGWEDGTPPTYLHELVTYWRDAFDWRAREAELNRFHHLRGEVGGTTLHLIHEQGNGPAPLPLVLAHGWPDSFFRFHKLIPLLTDPGAHGGDPADAFHVVVPSLPGYGFSTRTDSEPDIFHFGTVFHEAMQALGYSRYGAHGGDIGSSVCEQLAQRHAGSLVGVHLTDVPSVHARNPPAHVSAEEQRFLDRYKEWQQKEGGYMHIQGTRPYTAAAALQDSPAGLLAWMVEKFYDWSDCHGEIESRFTKDELLTNAMLYWATGSIGTSFLAYRDFTKAGPARWALEATKDAVHLGKAPAGFALFPKDIATPPRSWAERFFKVERFTEMKAGGHFAAMEEPEALAEELRAFFRPLR